MLRSQPSHATSIPTTSPANSAPNAQIHHNKRLSIPAMYVCSRSAEERWDDRTVLRGWESRGELFRYRCGSCASVFSLHYICEEAGLAGVPGFALRVKRWAVVKSGVACWRGMYLMVLPVLNRIHWGIGLFCFWAFASFCFVRKVLWLCVRRILSASVLFQTRSCPHLQSTPHFPSLAFCSKISPSEIKSHPRNQRNNTYRHLDDWRGVEVLWRWRSWFSRWSWMSIFLSSKIRVSPSCLDAWSVFERWRVLSDWPEAKFDFWLSSILKRNRVYF